MFSPRLALTVLRESSRGSTQRLRALSSVAAAVQSPAEKGPNPRRHTLVEKKKEAASSSATPVVNVHQAVSLVQAAAWAKFDETVEISLVTGLDPRKPNQSVKGVAKLPSGTGKKTRICVVAGVADAKAALEAGADVAGGEEVIAAIQGGDLAFDTVIATPEMMPLIGKIGRILGPRGLMPNPKMGTVTKDVSKAVKTAMAGAVQFKTEKKGVIQAGLGKVSFSKEALLENVRAFMVAVMDAKPENFKGKYLKEAHLSSTMGPGVAVDLHSVDPSNPKFMLDLPPAAPKKTK